MRCKICNLEYNGNQCPNCGFITLNMVPGTPSNIVEIYQQELTNAKNEWEKPHKTVIDPKPLVGSGKTSGLSHIGKDYYKLGWGRNHPGYLVYLVDLSESMGLYGRIDYVIDTIGQVCEYLIGMCEDEDDKGNIIIKDRFFIKILGYNSDVFELQERCSAVELDKKLESLKGKPMFDKNGKAKPQWQTYTAKAFKAVAADIRQWIDEQNGRGIPTPAPIVIHITDGYPYEEELRNNLNEARRKALDEATDIKNICVPDGHVLLFNIHIDKDDKEKLSFPVECPTDVERKFLFEASSQMTDDFVIRARDGFQLPAKEGSRFMVSNESDRIALAKLVAFGSSVTSNGNSNRELPKFIPK